ncbi:MAG: GIY-YIG nuclease family protein, partial [bacterium]|nr:GIY-YIG nuclease family protein [bacterium]
MFFVYVLRSFKDQKFYIGYTEDLNKRVSHHLLGEVPATQSRLPLQLIYYEAYVDKRDAKGREKFLKGGSGHKYLKKQLVHY